MDGIQSVLDCENQREHGHWEGTHTTTLTYISSDNEFAGGRFMVSMAMPNFSSTVLITRSALLELAAAEVEKRFSGPRPLNRISCVRMRVFIEVYDVTIIMFHFIFEVMTLGRILTSESVWNLFRVSCRDG